MAEEERESHGWRRPKANKRYLEAIALEQQRAQEKEEEKEEEEEVPPPCCNTSNKKNKVSTPPPLQEHRLAPFLPNPTSKVMDRISRAFTHRLYLIDTKPSTTDSPPSTCDFIVLGATGNVYTVTLDLVPSCTCPDHANGNTCKHILFVMLRVLKLPRDDPRVWQKALLPSEVHALLHNPTINDGILASKRVRERFMHITKETAPVLSSEETSHLKPGQRAIDGDCPICYEPMAGTDGKPVESVVFCKACGNNVHMDCFKRWSQSKGHGRVTCIYCRAQWKSDDEDDGKTSRYINLASYSDGHGPEATRPEVLYPDSDRWWER